MATRFRLFRSMIWSLFLLALAQQTFAENRFPRPEFESGYVVPQPVVTAPRAPYLQYADTAILLIALCAASLLALRRRSRREIFLLMVLCVLYFGFWRQGCICPVGSVQNVILALSDSTYALPLTVLAFFVLPLAFTLFFGRAFCAAVCPLGGLQDMVVLRPIRVSRWLAHLLGLIPIFYLAATIIFAAAGGLFLTCRYDPFVGFFRRGAPLALLVAGGALLLLGLFVARPYCRFLCPLGALLGPASWLARRHVTITPEECVNCRLCQDSCPFDAIQFPQTELSPAARRRETRWAAGLIAALPLIVLLGAWAGGRLGPRLAGSQLQVKIARELEELQSDPSRSPSEDVQRFQETGTAPMALRAAAASTERRFLLWSRIAGGGVALLLMLKLLQLSMHRRQEGYEPIRGECFSCGRCFRYCPIQRRKREEKAALPQTASQ